MDVQGARLPCQVSVSPSWCLINMAQACGVSFSVFDGGLPPHNMQQVQCGSQLWELCQSRLADFAHDDVTTAAAATGQSPV